MCTGIYWLYIISVIGLVIFKITPFACLTFRLTYTCSVSLSALKKNNLNHGFSLQPYWYLFDPTYYIMRLRCISASLFFFFLLFSTYAHCSVWIGWFLLTNIKECLICGTRWFMCVCICVCVCACVCLCEFVVADYVISIQYCSTHKKWSHKYLWL